MFRTSVRAFKAICTICVAVAVREQKELLLTTLPLTKSEPVLIISPEIALLTGLGILQSDSEDCAISITGDIISQTQRCKIVTHLKRSLIVDDISLITILLISRTDTAYLTTRHQILTGNIRTREALCYIYFVHPCATILIGNTIYTNLIVYVVKRQNCTRLLFTRIRYVRAVINCFTFQ